MNAPRKKKAVKLYESYGTKGLTHDEAMDKLRNDLDNNYSKPEIEEIEAHLEEEGLKILKKIAAQVPTSQEKADNKGKPKNLQLSGGNRHYEQWQVDVKWPRDPDDHNKIPKGAVPTVEKLKRLRDRVIIIKETADTMNHGHMSPGCIHPTLFLLPDADMPEGY